jgi:hypothetical protein
LYQNSGLSVLSSIGETENVAGGQVRRVGWVGGRQPCFFGKKFPGERRSVRLRFRVTRASYFVAKVGSEVFALFHSLAIKRQSNMRNWLFGSPGRILWSQRTLWTCYRLCP